MRLKRTQNDFRVSEILDDDSLLGDGPFAVYRVTKRGLTTFEAADLLAKAAGVERTAVAYAGLKDKDGITSQVMTVESGKPVTFRDKAMTIRPLGKAVRAIESGDSKGNSFEIFVRDLEADDMRRIRVNLNQVRKAGLPNYFDDQRFGCLRHGQGFVVRSLLRNDFEGALRALLAAPSRYGAEPVEKFKKGIQQRWGNWEDLADYTRNRRGFSVFEHLKSNPGDFRGALERGVATRERTIHLFAYQSYLWNRAVSLKIQEVVEEADLAWLPCDAGPLPVYRGIATSMYKELQDFELPLLGPDTEMTEETERLYKKVFRHEGLPMSAFLELDLGGFRPQSEMRSVLVDPEFLRAAPAETDEIYRRRQKMRVRFSLPRGHYATLVCKRLLMPTDKDYMALRIWVARHPLDWPNDAGQVPAETDYNDRRHYSERGHARGYHSPGARDFNREDRPVFVRGGRDFNRGGRDDRRDFNRGGRDDRRDSHREGRRDFQRSDARGGGGYGGNRDDNRGGGWGGNRDDNRGGGYRGNRNDNRGGGYRGNRDDNRGGGYGGNRDDNRGGGYGGNRDDNRGGGYRGNREDNRGGGGGYGRPRDDNRGDNRGGAWGGNRGSRDDQRGGGGGYGRPRDDNRGGGYGGNRDDNRGGGYGGNREDNRGGGGAWQGNRNNRDQQGEGRWGNRRDEGRDQGRDENRGSWGDKPKDAPTPRDTPDVRADSTPETPTPKPSPKADGPPADSPWAQAMKSKKESNDDS
jgi:tRNA pseudouridine13 synthase